MKLKKRISKKEKNRLREEKVVNFLDLVNKYEKEIEDQTLEKDRDCSNCEKQSRHIICENCSRNEKPLVKEDNWSPIIDYDIIDKKMEMIKNEN